jgi:hypothetical protein
MSRARNLLRGDILATAFTWCLSHQDRDPALFAGRDLFWEHEEVIGQLANLDNVSRATLEELLRDFEQRLQQAGMSLGPSLRAQRAIAADLGDPDLARQADRALRRLGPCERGSVRDQIEYQLFLDNEEEALALARRYLRHPSRAYPQEVGTIRCWILLPLLRRGEVDAVLAMQKQCFSYLKPEVCYYWPYGEILKSLVLTGQTAQAIQVYERCQRAIGKLTDPLTRLHFALDAVVLWDRLTAQGQGPIPLRLPDTVPVACGAAGYPVAALRDYLHQEAADLAARFDRRNGNGYFTAQHHERAQLQHWVLPQPGASPPQESGLG